MGEALNGLKRNIMCGDARESHIGQKVTVMGWVQRNRNLGGLQFIDLRDREGILQVVFNDDLGEEILEKAKSIRPEYCIAVTGEIVKRESVNPNMPTGMVELKAEELKILSESDTPPIYIKEDLDAAESIRLKYRYLDLRRPDMQNIFKIRHKTTKAIRDYLDQNGFLEMETPILTKSTPEGARDYLVPSRNYPGMFYALPQSPQLFKQLLMVSGFDRYFQIVKCFRDEDLRADRQPEFTQIDTEMSFVEAEDVMTIMEKMVQEIFKETINVDIELPLPRMTYAEAMDRYGSDKPDTRFGYEFVNITDLVEGCGFKVFADCAEKGKSVRGINVEGMAEKFPRKQISHLEDCAKTYKAKGLAWMKITEEGVTSPIAKFFSEEDLNAIVERMNGKVGDLLLFVADKDAIVYDALGQVRLAVAEKLGILEEKKNQFNFLWVTEFPLFEEDEENGRYVAKHHPFTSPLDEDIDRLDTDEKDTLRAKAYDIVLNGYEVGGGSVRISDSEVQKKMFAALGLSEEEAYNKFGFLLDAFKYGAPPHAGMAFGLDRLVMLLAGVDNIREVIAFPKNQNAICPMTNAPAPAEDAQLEELSIKVDIKEEN